MVQPNPFDELPIYGPWRVDPFNGRRRPQLFSSLTHWYEASKFDASVEPDLHSAALLMPSPKLVRKFTARHAGKARLDWPLIRGRVLMQGLLLAHLQYPRECLWTFSAARIAELLVEHGVHDRLAGSFVEQFMARRNSPKVLVLGAVSAPPNEVGRRINALHKRLAGMWVLQHWLGRNGCWDVHDWADTNRLGISVSGTPGQRLTPKSVEEMIVSCDQVLMFEKRGGRTLDRVAQAAKRAGRPLEIALWGDAAGAEGGISGNSLQVKSENRRATPPPMGDLFD